MDPGILSIRLFREMELRLGGQTLPALESARAESLLAFLLLHRAAPQSRQRLAFLLWPDSSEAQARTNLRHVLHTLRHALPEPDRYLEVTARALQWRVDAPYWLDIAAFEEATERAANQGALGALREAVDLYAGDLLEGRYDEWLLPQRERLQRRFLDTLAKLAAKLDAAGEVSEAIRYAERLLVHDPLHEETYRRLMRLHDAQGDRARALRTYHVCTATLERELGVEPSAATRAAYEALLLSEPGATEEAGADRAGGLPLVGRSRERARLVSLWRASEAGEAKFVVISGEAGIGKTRLMDDLTVWCARRGAAIAVARSYLAEGALAYGALVAWLRAEPVKGRLARLDRAALTELARLLPELLAEIPGLPRPEPLPEREQRQRLFDAASRALLGTGSPLLLVADDLQWCDPETFQFLHYLMRVDPAARLLVAATARSDELDRPALSDLLTWLRASGRLSEVALERLTRDETASLAASLARQAGHAVDADALFRETEGNPLFVVEAVRAGWAAGSVDHPVSPRVQAAIETRLAALSEPARELAGLAAAIGREFTADVLAATSELDQTRMVRALDELWRRDLIREQGIDAYDFSHDKIREVAYGGLSPAWRRHHHRRIAEALESIYEHDSGAVSGQLAAHYDRAGAADEAIAWYRRAAEAAQQMHANAEAIRLLDRALELLRTRPESHRRDEEELAILTALPASLPMVAGFASGRFADVHQRALALSRSLDIEPAAPLLRSLAFVSLSRGDFAAARDFGEQLRANGERAGDPVLSVVGEYVPALAAFWQGELSEAARQLEAVVTHSRPEHRRDHLLRYGMDPHVVCQSRLGNALWFLGRPAAAAAARDRALALAEEIGHPFSQATAVVFSALLAVEMGNLDRLRRDAAWLATETTDEENLQARIGSGAFLGYLDAVDGRGDAGLVRIRHAIDATRGAEQAPGIYSCMVRLMLGACVLAGEARTGLATVDEALAIGGAVRLWEAEFRRLRALFLADLGAPEGEVEAELERSLEIARVQGARSFELRTAVTLLQRQLDAGDGVGAKAARDLLAAVVASLPEATDTPDRRTATALLSP